MSNNFTETRTTSWFARQRDSVGGVVIGLILVIAMVLLLFGNEGRAVKTARSLAEGAGAVVSASADAVDSANEGKLVHVSGAVITRSTPSDPDFGISAEGVRLVRNVEMYQWKEEKKSETKKNPGGSEQTATTYTYSKAWSDVPIDFGSFREPGDHENPSMEIQGRSFQVPEGKLGAFTLDKGVLDRIRGGKALSLTPDQQEAIGAAYAGGKKLTIVDGGIYLGWNPSSPEVGDYRIKYEVVPLGVVSVIGQQRGAGFVPYQTTAGDQLLMVSNGNVPADRMFEEAESANTIMTWGLRFVGLLLLAGGFWLLMNPIAVLADVIPPLGSLIRFGTGLVAFIFAIVTGTITIGVAWLYYRPLVSIGVLVVGALVAAAIIYFGRSRRQSVAAANTPAAPG